MQIELHLFGAFRALQPGDRLRLEVADGATVAELRQAIEHYGRQHWPAFRPGLLAASAFASDSLILREHEALPDDGRVAVLPPVSGG